jgi:hypothetical protein
MLNSHSPVKIEWYEGLDNFMSVAQSEDAVLAYFFTVRNWDFIKEIYTAVVLEDELHLDSSGFEFSADKLVIYNQAGETEIDKYDFFVLLSRLYNVLIEGANEDHHTVRYETWWQDFIEKFFLLEERCKIEALQQEEEIVTLRVEA